MSTTGASPRSARLGRNLRSAILVGVGLGVVIIASVVFVRQAFVGVVAVCVAVASWELATRSAAGASTGWRCRCCWSVGRRSSG